MVIAVNARFLVEGNLEGFGHFTAEIFSRLVKQYPEHQFHFLFDRPYSTRFLFGTNVHPAVLKPPARHPILWRWWFDVAVPLCLRKIKADVFISPDGFCSLLTSVPQVMVVHDLGFLQEAKWYKRGHAAFYKYHMPRYINNATVVATVSDYTKEDILKQYKPKKEPVVLYNAARTLFQPLSFKEKVIVKEKHTSGREYFIYVGAIHPRKNLVNLLKAFSLFKKRQRSNWKLVLTGRMAWKNNTFEQLLATYKYRDDVVVTGYIKEQELAKLLGAAYAMVYPSLFEGFGMPVLEAMQCGVPVGTSQNSAMQEVAGDAALYFDPADPALIAESLMRMYKDEHLRNEMIHKGLKRSQEFSWDNTAHQMWGCIKKAVEG